MSVELLLTEISAITKKYELINQKTGGYFNIFEITNIASDEVKICRVLYELLNPKGSHYQGWVYLNLFVKDVLKITDFDLKSASVYREYIIDHNRRIDLCIQNQDYFIPIEVKIYAGDQDGQCSDYYKYAKNSNVYYLTLFGEPPSPYSAKDFTPHEDGNYKEVTTISFKDDILDWLSICTQQKETLVLAPIREILLQFIAVIRKLTGQIEEGKEMEVKDLIMKSSDNIKSAFAIESSLKECKIALLYKVFQSLETRLDALGMKKIQIYDYNGPKVDKFYDRKESTYPGISYMYKENVKSDIDILFRIEMAEYLIAGFCVAYKREAGKQQLSTDEIKLLIPHIEPDTDGWWAYWDNIPYYNDETPNFKNPDSDDAYFKLYDDDYFDKFINDCVSRIIELYK